MIERFPDTRFRAFALGQLRDHFRYSIHERDLTPSQVYDIIQYSYLVQVYVRKHPISSIQPIYL